jgi:hypothetical protein
VDENT